MNTTTINSVFPPKNLTEFFPMKISLTKYLIEKCFDGVDLELMRLSNQYTCVCVCECMSVKRSKAFLI